MRWFRKTVFWLHLVCGAATGLAVFVMSATGVVLTYEKQVLEWADGFVADDSGGGTPLGPSALLSRIQIERGKRPTSIRFLSDPAKPVRIYFGRESVAVDPYTGEGFGEGAVGLRGFFRSMIVLHRWLGQEGAGRAAGKAITGACNLGFLFIVVSGIYLWWPHSWKWQRLRQIIAFRRGLSPKARDFNWHNVMGFWCAVPLAVTVATATFFSYSWTSDILYALTGEERPPPRSSGPPATELPEPADFSRMDLMFAKAKEAEPEWKIATLNLPARPEDSVVCSIHLGNGFRPDLQASVVLHHETAEVLKHETYADMSPARSARFWIRFLHTGEAFGWIGQTVAGIASLAACVLVYTGWALGWRRFQAWRRRRS